MKEKECKHEWAWEEGTERNSKGLPVDIKVWCKKCGMKRVLGFGEIIPKPEPKPKPKPEPGKYLHPALDLEDDFPWSKLGLLEIIEKQKVCKHETWYLCDETNDINYCESWLWHLMPYKEFYKCYNCGIQAYFFHGKQEGLGYNTLPEPDHLFHIACDLNRDLPWAKLNHLDLIEKDKTCKHETWYLCDETNDQEWFLDSIYHDVHGWEYFRCYDCGLPIYFFKGKQNGDEHKKTHRSDSRFNITKPL